VFWRVSALRPTTIGRPSHGMIGFSGKQAGENLWIWRYMLARSNLILPLSERNLAY